MNVPVTLESDLTNRAEFAQRLAERLNSSIIEKTDGNTLYFAVGDKTCCLHAPELGSPIQIDFTTGKNAHRRKFGGGRGQPLAKAIGLKNGATPSVIDATAGYGRDAFVIANLGCEVTLLERQPILWGLLHDAINIARTDDEIADVAMRMSLINQSSIDYLQTLDKANWPDVIYMDPMYPSRDKSALVKKEMQLLHNLVGPDTDSNELLTISLQRAKKRVVIKRPKGASFVASTPPSVSIESKNTRYDVYVTNLN
jgi:16S rRNA (guanine1516-N2)-methyltransferase